jgi:ATPase family associated with various cellular activities (AAA)
LSDKIEFFEFFTNLQPEESGSNMKMDCPFCEREGKFYYNKDLMWDCKVCGKSGNKYSFMHMLHETLPTASELDFLVDRKNLPLRALQNFEIRFNHWNNSFLIPTFRNGKLNNLYKYVKSADRIYSAPNTDHTLFNYPDQVKQTVYLMEGFWDRIAMDCTVNRDDEITVTGVPGANVFKPEWCSIFRDKDLVLFYDNDEAGLSGMTRLCEKIIASSHHKPRSIRYIDWTGKPDKYDFRDMFVEYRNDTPKEIVKRLTIYTPPEGISVVKTELETIEEDTSCDTFDKLIEKFQTVYHVTRDMKFCLLTVLSSIYSVRIEGEQLWLRIIGPPGCGKTTIAKAVSASSQVVMRSTLTGIFSGWKDDDESDASLIPIIAGKSLLIKDADALLRQQNVEKIFSELRDFYDKDSSTQFKNRVQHDYRNIRATMILCGTNVLRRSDQSFLGERFLDFEMHLNQEDEDEVSRRMLARSIQVAEDPTSLSPETPVQAATKGFISHLMNRVVDFKITNYESTKILILAWLTAKLRSKVDRDKKEEITFNPISEAPPRLIGQLIKLYFSARVVCQDPKMTMSLILKIVNDILDPNSTRYKICAEMAEHETALSRDELVEKTRESKTSVSRELADMIALKFIITEVCDGSGAGRKLHKFRLRPTLKLAFLELFK